MPEERISCASPEALAFRSLYHGRRVSQGRLRNPKALWCDRTGRAPFRLDGSFMNVDLLKAVGLKPFDQSVDEVLALADAVWYEGFCPGVEDIEALFGQADITNLKRLLYVLETLCLFPVCPRSTANPLLETVQIFHDRYLGTGTLKEFVDKSPKANLNERWGLDEKTTSMRQALLPIQTRHYAYERGGQHGFVE